MGVFTWGWRRHGNSSTLLPCCLSRVRWLHIGHRSIPISACIQTCIEMKRVLKLPIAVTVKPLRKLSADLHRTVKQCSIKYPSWKMTSIVNSPSSNELKCLNYHIRRHIDTTKEVKKLNEWNCDDSVYTLSFNASWVPVDFSCHDVTDQERSVRNIGENNSKGFHSLFSRLIDVPSSTSASFRPILIFYWQLLQF
jgi:hypothetical protein